MNDFHMKISQYMVCKMLFAYIRIHYIPMCGKIKEGYWVTTKILLGDNEVFYPTEAILQRVLQEYIQLYQGR